MTVDVANTRLRPALILAALFVLALMPRLYSVQSLGWDWDYPGSFTLVNFDEGGSCRAALDGFSYSTFIGRQTIALASFIGAGPPEGIAGNERAVKAYCHSPVHITVARLYSALLGAMTVVAVAVLALQLMPGQPAIAWTAAALLALSGFHISESHSATVDAPLVFFVYCFLALLAWSLRRHSAAGLVFSVLLTVAAVWAKYWVFALIAWLALLPPAGWAYLLQGFTAMRLLLMITVLTVFLGGVSNTAFPVLGLLPILGVYGLLVPWRKVAKPMALVWLLLPATAWLLMQVELIELYTRSTVDGRFGSGYGAIGAYKWLRNLANIPAVLILGLGIPACLFIPLGLRRFARERQQLQLQLWVCLLPLLAFVLFMAFLAPVTYYRHYLALLPAAAIFAAMGLHASSWGSRPWFLALFFLWPALLAADLIADYHQDPRIALRQWYRENPHARVLASFYVNPPVASDTRLFLPSGDDTAALERADYLILSENWYDTAFANELNGPRVDRLERLIKTTPTAARFYREAMAGEHPRLELVQSIELSSTMPELVVHRQLYGNFPLFVGDLRIFRVIP